jgi:hypothetical protein
MAAAANRMRHFTPLAHRMPPPAAAAATWTEQQQQLQQQHPLPVGSAPPQLCPQNGPPPRYPAVGDHLRQPAPQPRRNRFTYVAPASKGTLEASLSHRHHLQRLTIRDNPSPRRRGQVSSRPQRQGITLRDLLTTPL